MSKLTIAEREYADGVVLDLSGDLVFGEPVAFFRKRIRECLRACATNIRLDFKNAGHVDSSGIGEMISALTAVGREGGHLQLINLSERIQWLLEISKLTEVFEIISSDEQAPVD